MIVLSSPNGIWFWNSNSVDFKDSKTYKTTKRDFYKKIEYEYKSLCNYCYDEIINYNYLLFSCDNCNVDHFVDFNNEYSWHEIHTIKHKFNGYLYKYNYKSIEPKIICIDCLKNEELYGEPPNKKRKI